MTDVLIHKGLRVLPDLIQGTEEWHEQRRGMVTASVVGRLLSVRSATGIDHDCPKCGSESSAPCISLVKRNGVEGAPIASIHPERTAVAIKLRGQTPLIVEPSTGDEAQGLTALLTAERITNWTDPTYMNDDMLRGVEDEPRAIDVYAKHYAPVTRIGFMVRDDWGFDIGYSPDGLVGDEGLIEVKSRRAKKQVLTIVSGEVPAENLAQMQCGLLVSGRAWCDYVSYSGGLHMWRKRVYPDPVWFEAIVAAVQTFEENAARMIAAYNKATVDLPMTERVVEMEMVI